MKKITMTELDKLIKANQDNTTSTLEYPMDGNNIEVEVKYAISLEDMTALVTNTVSNLFKNADTGDVIYCPELYDVSLSANILEYYTNIKGSISNDRLVDIVYRTKLMSDIVSKISPLQYSELQSYIDKRVHYICNAVLTSQQNNLNAVAAKLESAASAFTALNEQFSSVGTESFQKAVENISRMTPDDFASALVTANGEV